MAGRRADALAQLYRCYLRCYSPCHTIPYAARRPRRFWLPANTCPVAALPAHTCYYLTVPLYSWPATCRRRAFLITLQQHSTHYLLLTEGAVLLPVPARHRRALLGSCTFAALLVTTAYTRTTHTLPPHTPLPLPACPLVPTPCYRAHLLHTHTCALLPACTFTTPHHHTPTTFPTHTVGLGSISKHQ